MGSIICSCGHEVFSGNDMIPVEHSDEVIDHDEQRFVPCIVSATFCPACAAKIAEWPNGRIVK